MTIVKERHFSSQIFLLLFSRLLSKRFPHKHGVESLGVNKSQLLCLGGSLGKNSNSRSAKKEGLESSKQKLFVQG